MVWLRCALGSVAGALQGFLAGAIFGIVAFIVVGIATWNSNIGGIVAGLVLLSGVLVGAVMGFARPLEEERKKEKAEEEEALRQRKRRESEFRSRIDRLSNLLSDSQKQFLRLREIVPSAQRHLDRAEQEFTEGAFAPFWDEIELATNKLAAYQRGVENIHRNAVQYRDESTGLPARIPRFDLPTGELPDGRSTATRLQTVVRKAQKDFQFASIYEQRKTNQILVSGFGTLASAIYAIGDSITSSLDNLSSSLDTSLDKLLEDSREHSRQAQLAAERHLETLAEQSKYAAAQATKRRRFEHQVVENQKEQVKILDNIQRGKKPFP